MATIEAYASGRILRSIRLARHILMPAGIPVIGRIFARGLERRMEPFAIRPVTREQAAEQIAGCRYCAVGPRVCSPLDPGAPFTESVFLDDLAEAMAGAGKALMVSRREACAALDRYPENPILLAKVSGRFLEICRSEPSVCVYWRMRRKGLKV